MKNDPLVSIAIITYNQKEFLRECIDSCLAQDYQNIQIVVADDFSSDGTQEMLKEYDRENPGKFLIQLASSNQGITSNSNVANFACTGKYIAWIGGDDLMLPRKISKQVAFMEENPECTICYHSRDVFDSETNKTIKISNIKDKINGDIRESIKYGTFNGACSTMVRKDKTPKTGFNISLPVASDWLYWVDTLANGGTINYIDEVLSRYRRHENNITSSEMFMKQNEIDLLVTSQIMLASYPEYTNEILFSYGKHLTSLRHKTNYFPCLSKGLLLSPSFKASGALLIALATFGKLKF